MANKPDPLGTYDGRPILGSQMSIRNTGDGLSQALSVAPVHEPIGSKLYVVLEVEVEKHRHDPIKDTDGLTLVHMTKAKRATLVGKRVVNKYLNEMDEKIAAAQPVEDEPLPLDKDVPPEVVDGK